MEPLLAESEALVNILTAIVKTTTSSNPSTKG